MAQPLRRAERSPHARGRRRAAPATLPLLAALLAACGGGRQPPSADAPQPLPPNLAGAVVMLLPLQDAAYAQMPTVDGTTAGEQLDAELAYWLAERGAGVRWVPPTRLQDVLGRSPGLGIDIANLDVQVFRRARVDRVGDPLFGDLVRLGALVNARFALIPAFAAYRPGADGQPGRVEIAATIIDASDGRVYWFGIVAGEPGPPGERGTAASAAQALARTLFR